MIVKFYGGPLDGAVREWECGDLPRMLKIPIPSAPVQMRSEVPAFWPIEYACHRYRRGLDVRSSSGFSYFYEGEFSERI